MKPRRTKTKLLNEHIINSVERLLETARARQRVILSGDSMPAYDDEYYHIGKHAAIVDSFLNGEWDKQ